MIAVLNILIGNIIGLNQMHEMWIIAIDECLLVSQSVCHAEFADDCFQMAPP